MDKQSENSQAKLVFSDSSRIYSVQFEGIFTDESAPNIFPSKPFKIQEKKPIYKKRRF